MNDQAIGPDTKAPQSPPLFFSSYSSYRSCQRGANDELVQVLEAAINGVILIGGASQEQTRSPPNAQRPTPNAQRPTPNAQRDIAFGTAQLHF